MEEYKLLPEAEKDLENIWQYTVKEWGTDQAIQYIDDIDRAFLLLAHTPLMCRERTEFTPPVRIHHHKKHLIVYLIEVTYITIIRVLHENMATELQLSENK